jgi:hypothetical protein
MFWLGIIIGLCAGVVIVTILYAPLLDMVKALEQMKIRDTELIDDAIKTLQAYEKQNALLRSDLEQLQRLVPPEIYARFFDAPYYNN